MSRSIALTCTMYLSIKNLNYARAQSPTEAARVLEAMHSLEEGQAGIVVDGPHVFLKRKREDIEADETAGKNFKTLITAEIYEEQYYKRDGKLSESYFKQLLKKHPDETELLEKFNLS